MEPLRDCYVRMEGESQSKVDGGDGSASFSWGGNPIDVAMMVASCMKADPIFCIAIKAAVEFMSSPSHHLDGVNDFPIK